MNTETNKVEWNETKAKIKSRFGKLTDENIESLKGSIDQLAGKLQHVYGYAKEQADREVANFKGSTLKAVDSTVAPVSPPEVKSAEATKEPAPSQSTKVA